MEKFSNVDKSKELGKFTISEQEFNTYVSTINDIIGEMYKDRLIEIEKMKLVKALPSEIKIGRDYSTLNKVNTNVKLMKRIVETFNLNNFQDLIDFVNTNNVELFTESGKYFNLVFSTIRETEEAGERNEEFVCDYIKKITKLKFDEDITPIREITSSYKDMILGIDITFLIRGKEYTCQVKPLKSFSFSGDYVVVQSSGNMKEYNTDYLAFSNPYTNKVLLFQNKKGGMSVNKNTVTLKRKSLVNI